MNKVYLVIFDGYLQGWGSYAYLLGIYDSESKAKEAIATLPDELRVEFSERVEIHEVEVDNTQKVHKDLIGDYFTDIMLGGYAE